ncbi:MAG TPA: metallophosphatase, partial [Planctomycetota bacterium]|nr:metallophosphatase [Planctomycetota bacterium]
MRFLAAPLAALLALFGISTAPPDGTPVRVVVLHTNDLHGQCLPRDAPGRKDAKIGGFAAIQAAVEREREAAKASGAHVVLVDAGDWYQGTPEGNLAKDGAPGALVVDWMGRVRYDAVAIGNHEFDFGVANVEKLLARARFPVLGANIVRPAPNAANGEKSATTVPFAKPYAVVERGGVRLAFVGLCSSETPRMTVAGRTGDLVFEDDTESARRWFDRARKEADLVFLLTHCGKEVDERLARRVPECPVIFGGHSHTRLEKAIVVDHEASAMSSNPWADGVPPRTYVVQSGAKAENLDRVALEIDPATKRIAKVDARLVPLLLEDVGEDAATKRWLAEETAPVATEMAKVLATVVPPE